MTKQEMVALAQRQLDAYNRGDLDAFCACYHPDVEVSRTIGAPPTVKGLAQFRTGYAERFAQSPELHCEVKSRIVLGETVLDEEHVTGLAGQPGVLHVVAIYGFRDGLISNVWFAR
jgi:hypothetical protein